MQEEPDLNMDEFKDRPHCKDYTVFQKSTKKALKKAHWQYVNDMLSQSPEEGNQKQFW